MEVPKFPTPKNQNLIAWFEVFNQYEKYMDKDTILIGHSLGSAFILNLLEKKNKKVKSAYLISPYYKLIGNDYFDTISKTFMKKFKWELIKKNCNNFFVYHSDNDIYLPVSISEELTNKLNGELKIIKDGGHLNKKAGFTKFEVLLEDIKMFLEKDL